MKIKGRPKGELSIEDCEFLDRRKVSITERRRERKKRVKSVLEKKDSKEGNNKERR